VDYLSYGNQRRRILKEEEGTSFLAIKAAQDLLAKSMILRN
jgi:3-oxoacyl-[acyl-carrier-protein] synthase III